MPLPTLEAPAAPFDRHVSMGYEVNHLARLFARSLRARIAALGVVPGQFAQLLALFEEDGLTQTELCERVCIDPSTMAHTLKRMERDGLVRRVRDGEDRRRARVHLTPSARAMQPELTRVAAEVNAIALQGVEGAEAERLLRTLERLIANLEADPAAPEARP